MCFSSAVFGQSGCVPFFFAEENTKFSAWLYAHSARQVRVCSPLQLAWTFGPQPSLIFARVRAVRFRHKPRVDEHLFSCTINASYFYERAQAFKKNDHR